MYGEARVISEIVYLLSIKFNGQTVKVVDKVCTQTKTTKETENPHTGKQTGNYTYLRNIFRFVNTSRYL